jgi:hypothetical protein
MSTETAPAAEVQRIGVPKLKIKQTFGKEGLFVRFADEFMQFQQ